MPKGKPPNLRISYDPSKCCGTCAGYLPDGRGELSKSGGCDPYKNYDVRKHEVCDEHKTKS